MPLTGSGTVLGDALAAQFGVTDPVAVANFVAMANVIVAHIVANAIVLPLPSLVAPPSGGPVTGAGTVT